MLKNKYIFFVIILLSLGFFLPLFSAVSTSSNTNPSIGVESFSPQVWMCDSRVVYDDNTEPGRISNFCLDAVGRAVSIFTTEATCEATGICIATYYNESQCNAAAPTTAWVNGFCTVPILTTPTDCASFGNTWILNTWTNELVERINNYAFEGEQIQLVVLVMDKNKIDQNLDVFTAKGSDKISSSRIKIIKVNKTISYCDSTGVLFVPWSTDLSVPKFNTTLGKLVKVSINGSALIEINASFENTNPVTGSNYTITYNGGIISIDFPENNFPILNDGFIVNGFVSPYDNITDFAGTSGRSFNFINSSIINFNGINLSMYNANFSGENLLIPASSSGNAEIIGLANFDGGVTTMSGADICIKYTYETEETVSGANYDIESNCERIGCDQTLMPACNARIDEERITTCNPEIMDMFRCTFTVETPESMYGEYWINVVAMDNEGNTGVMDENEYWYLNPVIALSVDGDMTFDEVRPGTDSYSNTMLVGNDADDSSGVILDMFISGTDFYDTTSSGARCPDTNQLNLDSFRYFATNGAYSTMGDLQIDSSGSVARTRDSEGYVNIDYGIGFNNPTPFYNDKEIIQSQLQAPYYAANILAPGAEMAVTIKLSLPEPCVGNFDSGSIYFWGEAI